MTAGLPWLLLIAALWLQLFHAASYGWIYGSYYDYGWYVPPLAALFFIRVLAGADRLKEPFPSFVPQALLVAALGGALTILRVLEKVDQSWTLPLWIHAVIVAGVTFLLVGRMGGGAMAMRMIPVVIFALTAVRLPSVLESAIVSAMTKGVVESSAWLLGLLGRDVKVLGSQLELSGLMVHVTEGCSGIRSVQSFLMVSLFFGEWMRLSLGGRFLMVACGLATAWALNVARACGLSLIRFDHGQQAFEKAHDLLGLAAFVAGSLILLWVSSRLGSSPGRGMKLTRVVTGAAE